MQIFVTLKFVLPRLSTVPEVHELWLLILNLCCLLCIDLSVIMCRVDSCMSTMIQSLTLLRVITLTCNNYVKDTWERNSYFTPFNKYYCGE